MYIYWCKSLRYKSTCILPGKLPGKMLVLLNASTVGMRPPDIPAAPVEPAAPLPSPPEEEKEERAETQNQGPRAWWHGGEEAVNGDVDCFFGWGANWYFLLMIFGCFFLFANEGLKLEICSWSRCFCVGSLRWTIFCTRRCHCIWWPVGQNCLWGCFIWGCKHRHKKLSWSSSGKKRSMYIIYIWYVLKQCESWFLNILGCFCFLASRYKWYPNLEKQAIRNGFGKENPIQNDLGEMVEPVANQWKPQKSLNSHQNVGTSWMHLGKQ